LNFFAKPNTSSSELHAFRLLKLLSFHEKYQTALEKFNYFPSFLEILNDDSDKKKLHYPIYKIINTFNKKNLLLNLEEMYKFANQHDVATPILNLDATQSPHSYKTFSSFSSNQSVLTGSKSLRNFVNLKTTTGTFNHSTFANTISDYGSLLKNNNTAGILNFYNLSKTN